MTKNQNFNTAIFDMDGLLIDSEPCWLNAEKKIFSAYGLVLTEEMSYETRGLRIVEVIEHWNRQYHFASSKTEVLKIAHALEQKVIEEINLNAEALPGVLQTIELLKHHDFKIGLASSSSLSIIHTVLHKLEIQNYFEVVSSASDLEYGKPHPQVYLETAQKLESSPVQCIAFEDSITGLIACKAARMFAIAVPETLQRNNPKFQIADVCLQSLLDFNLDIIQ